MAEYQERYARQELIQGWVQQKLTDARVVVVGHDLLSEFINLGLAALGVGEIRIFTNYKNGKEVSVLGKLKRYIRYKGSEKAKMMAHVIKRLNNTIKAIDVHTELFTKEYFPLLNNPKIIIESTNNQKSKLMCWQYCKNNKISFISACASDTYGFVDVNPDESKLKNQFQIGEDKDQNLIVSEILAGFVIDEARKILLPLTQKEKVISKTLKYDLAGDNRF